jgi:hypothetical protein
LEAHRILTRAETPTFLDNLLTDDDEVVCLTRQPLFTLRKILGTNLY